MLVYLLGKKRPKIQIKPNKKYYNVGSNVNLTCEAEKDTNLYDITWYKVHSGWKDMQLGSTPGAGLSQGTLTVTLTSLLSTGVYKCVVSRPKVNYFSSELVIINIKGGDFNQSCFSLEDEQSFNPILEPLSGIENCNSIIICLIGL